MLGTGINLPTFINIKYGTSENVRLYKYQLMQYFQKSVSKPVTISFRFTCKDRVYTTESGRDHDRK